MIDGRLRQVAKKSRLGNEIRKRWGVAYTPVYWMSIFGSLEINLGICEGNGTVVEIINFEIYLESTEVCN